MYLSRAASVGHGSNQSGSGSELVRAVQFRECDRFEPELPVQEAGGTGSNRFPDGSK